MLNINSRNNICYLIHNTNKMSIIEQTEELLCRPTTSKTINLVNLRGAVKSIKLNNADSEFQLKLDNYTSTTLSKNKVLSIASIIDTDEIFSIMAQISPNQKQDAILKQTDTMKRYKYINISRFKKVELILKNPVLDTTKKYSIEIEKYNVINHY